jgi:ATP-binding cassette subfamily F protein uup
MTIFTLRSVKKDFGIKEILKDASFSLAEGDRVGLIGVNGCGKSTLLKMIAGLEPLDGGEIWVNSGAKIVYLPQDPNLDEEKTILEQVFADSGEKIALIREYEDISEQLAQNPEEEETLLARLSAVSQRLELLGAWDLERDAKIILAQLGIENLHTPIKNLSGGYRKRIALASALLSEPDGLLMDEPTNHLDALAVEWLQGYLQRFTGALLLITHDRYFLDQVTNRILEIDQGVLSGYAGNYAYYLQKKAEAEEMNQSSQRKHAGVLRRELEWLKRGPKARSTKQKARIDRIHAMQEQEFKQGNAKVEISTVGRRIGKKVIDLVNLGKSYGDRPIIKNFTYSFTPEERIGIIGKNGVGKSTLMNLISGRISPDSGRIEIGSTIHFGYFDQQSEDLNIKEDKRVIEYLKEVAELVNTVDGKVITVSQMLERFLFTPNQQYSPIAKLSGGERRRLFLLRVLLQSPNVLILDEPTTDLDVQTLGVLEEYLEDFNGCVIVVSHDRYFLDRTVDTIFAFEGNGEIKQYPGNYSVYLDYQKVQEEVIKTPPKKLEPEAKSSPSRKLSFKEKKEYEMLEQRIPELEGEKEKIEYLLSHNPPTEFTEIKQLSERLGEINQEIDAATERWLELAERS